MRKNLLKFISMGVVFAMLVMVMAACGGNDQGSTDVEDSTNVEESQSDDENAQAGDDDKEIIFWNIGTESPGVEIINYAIDKFHERTESGYTITSVPIQNDTYKERLVIAMSSGEAPDLYTHWSGGPMIEYIKAGFAVPVDHLVEAYNLADVVLEAGLAQGIYNGSYYAIPTKNVVVSGVFYNKEMYEQFGLEVPKTISELEEICDTLVENGITPFALANAAKWTGSMYFMNLATRYGGLDPFKSAVEGTGTFEHEAFEYAGEKIREWVEKGYFPEGVNSLSEDDGQSRQLLYQEAAAMTVIGSWYSGLLPAESEEFYEKIGWFPFPAVDGSDADSSIQIGTVGDQFISFNCEGDKLEAAFEMVSYYFEDDTAEFMVSVGNIPPVQFVGNLITDPVLKDIFTAATNASSTQLWYDQYLPPGVAQVHLDTCQELFGLTITPQEANARMQEAMERYIAEN